MFSRTTRRVPFHYIEFAVFRSTGGAIGKLAWETPAEESTFSYGFAGFSSGFTCACCIEALVDEAPCEFRVGLELVFETFTHDSLHDTVDFRVGEFGFGLSFEARFGDLYRDYGYETFAGIITRDCGVFVLEEVVGSSELVDHACECGAETRKMSPAFDIVDRIGVGENLLVVGVVVLHRHIDHDGWGVWVAFGILNVVAESDGVFVEGGLRAIEESDVFCDPVVELEGLGLVVAFVGNRYFDSWVEEGEFSEAFREDFVIKIEGCFEYFRIRLKADLGACLFGFSDDGELFGGLAFAEGHLVDLAVASDFGFEPFGNRVYALGSNTV